MVVAHQDLWSCFHSDSDESTSDSNQVDLNRPKSDCRLIPTVQTQRQFVLTVKKICLFENVCLKTVIIIILLKWAFFIIYYLYIISQVLWADTLWDKIYIYIYTYTFLRLGNFGKPFRLVRPTLIRLNDSRALNSFVRPTICVLRQLSRTSSLICNMRII